MWLFINFVRKLHATGLIHLHSLGELQLGKHPGGNEDLNLADVRGLTARSCSWCPSEFLCLPYVEFKLEWEGI